MKSTAVLTAILLTSTAGVAQGSGTTPKNAAKIVVIGIDGVSLNLLQPYSERGLTPNMGSLLKEGASGHLASIWPLRTPQVWTSVATGKYPGQHGIWDHLSNTYFNPPPYRTKKKLRVTTADRKSKALWNILDAKSVRTLTVGWMASWPAEKLDHGIMVAPIELMGDSRQTTIKGSFFRDAGKLTQPRKYWPKVKKLITEPHDIAAEEITPFAKVPAAGHPIYELPRLERYMYALKWSLARAKSVEAITLGMLDDANPEVVLSYFQCPDSLLHRFWIFSESEAEIRERLETHGIPSGQAKALKEHFSNVVEACYRDVDARVGRILEQTRGPDTLVLIISDHGFGWAVKPHRLKGEPYSGDHLDEGVLVAAGPGVRAGAWVEESSILDITPTILHRLGLPVAGDMKGGVIEAMYEPAYLTERPVKKIPTYEATPQLDAPYSDGWPVRKVPLRPTASQMPGAPGGR